MSSKALFRAFAVLMVLAPTAVQAQVTTLAEAARATATTGTATSVSGIVTLPGGMSGDGLIVRLRDAVTGEVVGTTVTNVSGEFSFGELEVGDFIIEIIDQNGVILSVSSVLAMSPWTSGGCAGAHPSAGAAAEQRTRQRHGWRGRGTCSLDGSNRAGDRQHFRRHGHHGVRGR